MPPVILIATWRHTLTGGISRSDVEVFTRPVDVDYTGLVDGVGNKRPGFEIKCLVEVKGGDRTGVVPGEGERLCGGNGCVS